MTDHTLWCARCRHHLTKHRLVGRTPMCDRCDGQGAIHKYLTVSGEVMTTVLWFLALAVLILVGGWLWG